VTVCIAAVCVGDRLHRIDDDRDEQVEHGEGGDQDERDEEHPGIGKDFHHRAHDAHRPAFQGHDLKQGVHRTTKAAEPLGEVGGEQARGDHRRDVEDQRQHHGDRAQPGNCRQQCADHAAHRRHHGHHAHHPQHAQGTQDAERTAGRHQGDGDYAEVEQTPGIAEERCTVDIDARGDFGNEYRQDQRIQQYQRLAPARHQRGRGLHA